MAELYVNGDLAAITSSGVLTTAGTGTAADPYHTLGQTTGASNGDTINVAGKCRQGVLYTSKTDLTVRQWSGQAQAEIRGDVVVPQGEWSVAAGNRYVATLAAGLTITSVVYDWDTNRWARQADHTIALDATGEIRAGHLIAAASQAACEATANSWFYS